MTTQSDDIGTRLYRAMEDAMSVGNYTEWDSMFQLALKVSKQICGKTIIDDMQADLPKHIHFQDGYIDFSVSLEDEEDTAIITWKKDGGYCE